MSPRAAQRATGLCFMRTGKRARTKSRRRRAVVFGAVLLIVAPIYYGLAFGRVVINGTDSLDATAFVMVTWPKLAIPGIVVALEMPEPLRLGLGLEKGRAVYVKRVLANAGERVMALEGAICVSDRCLAGFERGDGTTLDMWAGSRVPDGTVFVAGDSPDSLDSRYHIIGPRPVSEILAVGVPVGLPDWRTLQGMLGGGG